LRRTKAEVEKTCRQSRTDVHVAMTQSQRKLYSQILEEVRPRVFDAVTKKGIRCEHINFSCAT
jgi:SNF2 family DNA or RNA helicase